MANHNVLIIGSSGFIGQHIISKLCNSNSTSNVYGLSRSFFQSDLNFNLINKDWRELSVLELTNFDIVVFASRVPLQDRSQNLLNSEIECFFDSYKDLCSKFTLSKSTLSKKFIFFSSLNYAKNSFSERSRYFEIKERINLVTRDSIPASDLIEIVLPNVFGFNANVTPSNGLINNLIFNSLTNTATQIFDDTLIPKYYIHINILTSLLYEIISSSGDQTVDRIVLRGNNFFTNVEIASIVKSILIKFYGVNPKFLFEHGSVTLNEKLFVSCSFQQEIRETIDRYVQWFSF